LSDGPLTVGPSLAWAHRLEVAHVHVCTDAAVDEAAAKARQATAFSLPVTVWRVAGEAVTPIDPVALAPLAPLTAEQVALADEIRAAGAEPVLQEGILSAEVLGLEVARAIPDPETRRLALEIGVGHHDREARAMLGLAPGEGLAEVVETVQRLRTPDAALHPANQLALSGWLRAVLVRRPELVGATQLAAAPSPVTRADLRQPVPAVAVGTDQRGQPLVVVCAVGVDPELVPIAADARMAAALDANSDAGHMGLTLVVPEPDDYEVNRELASLLRHPATVVTVGSDWRHQ